MVVSVVLFAVGSAAAYAVAANLKHVSAGEVPDAQALTGGSIVRFVRATLTHRLWLLSIVVDLVGAALQILALRQGALAVVQPLLVSGLVIALLLRARAGGRVRRVEIAWAAVLVVVLIAFLAVADISRSRVAPADVRPAAFLGLLGLLVAAACVAAARRWRGRAVAPVVLGIAVGVVNASTAAMLKSLTSVAARGVLAVIGSWQVYVLVVLVGAAMFLNQLAFQAGPLAASLPVIASVDPLVSVVIGIVVFDETVRPGPFTVPAMIGLLAALAVAVVALSRRSAARTEDGPG